MTGFLPDPYPDELFVSICSRYDEQLGQSTENTGLDLFRSGRIQVAVDLPSNLDVFMAELPRHHLYTVEDFINDNTLYPLFDPFLPPDRANLLISDMRGSKGGAIHGRLGILTSPIKTDFLRYCPACVEEDRESWDETYWHRLHQVPGIMVCPTHHVFLVNSSVPTRSRGRMAYVTAEQVVEVGPIRHVNPEDYSEKLHLEIAEDAAWLLTQRGLIGGPKVLLNRYLFLLFKRGLATYPGTVYISKLIDAFKKHYPDEFLNSLHSGIDRRINWLIRLVQTSKGATQHPIHHILLIKFLDYSIDDFFQLSAERDNPFGSGPWPCLNRASNHFGQERITVCEIKTRQKDNSRPEAMFRCDCGFTYCRRGPDETPEARFEYSRVKSYGQVWDDTLLKLRNSEGLQAAEIASQLGVTQSIVSNRIRFLRNSPSLADNTSQHRTTLQAKSRWGRIAVAVTPEVLAKYRDQWLTAINENPMANRSTIREKIPAVFNFLYKRDKEWLECNSPSRQKSQGPAPQINWKELDTELCLKVESTATSIKNTAGRPVRASETVIARKLGVLSAIHKRAELLPLTVKALSEVAEDPEDYAIRRIDWAAGCFRQEGIYPQSWQLQIRAALSNKMAKVPKVRDKILAAVKSFEEI